MLLLGQRNTHDVARVRLEYVGADGVICFAFFETLTARVFGANALAADNRSLMLRCPLSQPVSPFPCYVLARGGLGKMRDTEAVFFPWFFLLAITQTELLFDLTF